MGGGGAEFFYSPTVNLECSALFLAQIAGSDPRATHVVIWDGAGFLPRDGESGLPANVRRLKLPAYRPEHNPVEKLWDVVKDGICNRVFATVSDLQEALSGVLAKYWSDAGGVSDLVGPRGLARGPSKLYLSERLPRCVV